MITVTESLAVQPVNPLQYPNWDTRISSSRGHSIFQSSAWAAVLQNTYGFKPVYFTVFRGKELQGFLPTMEVSSWLTGKRGVCLPFTDYCQGAASSEGLLQQLFQEALRYGRSKNWKYLEIRGGRGIPELHDSGPRSIGFFGHRLSLVPGLEKIFGDLEGRARNAIRKAEKSGVLTETSQTFNAVREYYSLHCKTRKKHGLPPQSFKFFSNIHRHIISQDLGTVVSAKFKGRIIASGIYFSNGDEAIHKFGASDLAFQDLRANNLVMWEAIKWCAAKGCKVLELGRTSLTNEGLRRYKLGWGTEEYVIDYFRYDLANKRLISLKDEAYGWHNRVFGALPIWVTRLIGAAIYRHVA